MSKNSIPLFFLFLLFAGRTIAQDNIVEGVTPDLYLLHKVAPKETWYSIGRNYNVEPKSLAVFNKLKIDKPLELGNSIKIPLTSTNFSQEENKPHGVVWIPLYHIVQPKEWLYRISVNNNKVPVERIEKWNSISKDDAKAGMKLIVGFLKVKDENSKLVAKAPDAEEKKTPKAPAAQAQEPSRLEPPKNPGTAERETPSQVQQVSNEKGEGYFKALYEGNGKNSSGVTGIFKSTSGWNDGKYYALMNDVPVGTIIRILLPQTNKTVYAKVLGELPEMRESAGLALRISDAAAGELGATQSKFSVDISY